MLTRVSDDLGDTASYLTLEKGARVIASDGEDVGTVEHVLADEDVDVFDGIVFDGIVFDVRLGPGGWRFADAEQVADVYERGVVLTVDNQAARALPEPTENPGAPTSHGEEDAPPSELQRKLQRAWDRISGNY